MIKNRALRFYVEYQTGFGLSCGIYRSKGQRSYNPLTDASKSRINEIIDHPKKSGWVWDFTNLYQDGITLVYRRRVL